MDERILKWLFDIKLSIEEIDIFFEGQSKNFYEYKQNLILKRAVERNLEIIGEAVNRIITRDNSFSEKISNARSIIGLRNQVIHSYDSISDENIWSVLINHLPKLKIENRRFDSWRVEWLIFNQNSNITPNVGTTVPEEFSNSFNLYESGLSGSISGVPFAFSTVVKYGLKYVF